MSVIGPEATPLLRLRGIRKAYPGVVALDGVDFDLRAGEVHVLLGENGAGKSTFVRILSGATTRDAGEIEIDGARGGDRGAARGAEARHQRDLPGVQPRAAALRGPEHLPGPGAVPRRRGGPRPAGGRGSRAARGAGRAPRPAHPGAVAGRRPAADGGGGQGAVHPGARADHGRADLRPHGVGDPRAVRGHARPDRARGRHHLYFASHGGDRAGRPPDHRLPRRPAGGDGGRGRSHGARSHPHDGRARADRAFPAPPRGPGRGAAARRAPGPRPAAARRRA